MDNPSLSAIERSESLLREGALCEAEALLKAVLDQGFKDSRIYHNLAVIEGSKGNLASSVEMLTRALESGPSLDSALDLSSILESQGRTSYSPSIFSSAIQNTPLPLDVAHSIRNNQPLIIKTKSSLQTLATSGLKIYSSTSCLPQDIKHHELLIPHFGAGISHDECLDNFTTYNKIGSQLFILSSLMDADLALFPAYYYPDRLPLLQKFLREVSPSGKKTLVLYRDDASEVVPAEDIIVLRTSLYRSQAKAGEIPLPPFVEDLVQHYLAGTPVLRAKSEKPSLSFCGQAIKEYLHHRNAALVILAFSRLINFNLILRDGYGGSRVDGRSKREVLRARLDFVKNMLHSDYALCVRGAGNFSYRFYEALCLGRIPVLLDTDCKLPFESQIDWDRHIIRVDYRDIATIEKRILDFHNSLTDQEFINRQIDLRNLWLQYFKPDTYYSKIITELKAYL